jgi:hypothetical protein
MIIAWGGFGPFAVDGRARGLYSAAMADLAPILAALRAAEPEFRSRGVDHMAVVGSTARGEAGPDSDIDLVIDPVPDARFSLIDQAWVQRRAQSLLGRPVDVALRRALRPAVRETMASDAVQAF